MVDVGVLAKPTWRCNNANTSDLLDRLRPEEKLPPDLPQGDFFIVLNGADEDLQLSLIEPVAGGLLLHMHTDSAYAPPPEDVVELLRAGLIVPLVQPTGSHQPTANPTCPGV